MWEIKGLVSHGKYIYAIVLDHPNRDKHNYVLLHRVVMENHIGRILSKDEIIHHIDNDGKNNDISNLLITTVSEHKSKYHKKYEDGNKINLICDNCEKDFKRYANRRNKDNSENNHNFCSKKCSDEFQTIESKIKRGIEFIHGTAASYRYCHCIDCKKAKALKEKEYRKRKKNN